jgi:transposase
MPSDIHGWLAAKNIEASSIIKVGLEAGAMSIWLCTELAQLGLPMIVKSEPLDSVSENID